QPAGDGPIDELGLLGKTDDRLGAFPVANAVDGLAGEIAGHRRRRQRGPAGATESAHDAPPPSLALERRRAVPARRRVYSVVERARQGDSRFLGAATVRERAPAPLRSRLRA